MFYATTTTITTNVYLSIFVILAHSVCFVKHLQLDSRRFDDSKNFDFSKSMKLPSPRCRPMFGA